MSRQPNPLRQQLLPVITIPDGTFGSPEADKKARLVYETMATAFQRLQALIDTDPRMSDTRIAHGVTTQQGDVIFDYATLPNPGDVPYAVDGGRRAVWGSGTTPAPTGGGVSPAVGSPHALLDGVQNNDTVAQTPSRGSLIYGNSTPKWDELVKPSVASILKNDATDAAWVTIPTRKKWLDTHFWSVASPNPPALALHGTYPDDYIAWDFDALNTEGIVTDFEVPEDWLTGTLTFKVRWATSGATATNWVPLLRYKERDDGDTLTVANTLITGPTTSANAAVDVLMTTTIGSFTPTTPNRIVRLIFERAPGGNDTYGGTIRVLGIRVEYTPSY